MAFNGDLSKLVRFIFLEKYDVTFGVLIGLTLGVVVLILIRSVMEEKGEAVAGEVPALDSKALGIAVEGAVKKALLDQGGAVAPKATAKADSAGEAGSAGDVELKKILSEREAKIAALMSDLEVLKSTVDVKANQGSAGDGDSALQKKIQELQAKLSEYEIIEDDIADLSLYKEENKKLKSEVEKLRAATETAQTQVQAAQTAVETPAAAADLVQAAQAAVVDVQPSTAPEAFKLDTEDEVMGEFAKALAGEAPPADEAVDSVVDAPEATTPAEAAEATAPAEALVAPAEAQAVAPENDPLFGALDTEKMLAEVASMGDGAGDASSVLEDQLDTDRLMAEMGMTDAPPDKAPAPAVEAPAAETAPAIPVKPPAPVIVEAGAPGSPGKPVAPTGADAPVDDLLAEFKDTDFETSKGTKGS